jgi:hypothetical protein
MSDTMARRVNLYDCADRSGIFEFDPNGTHMLVGVEAWKRDGWSVGTHILVDVEKWAAKNAEIERLRLENILPEDLEPVYATLHFYYNDPDSMGRLQACHDAPKVLQAVEDFERWLREVGDADWETLPIESVRDKLFACFADNAVVVPGWE